MSSHKFGPQFEKKRFRFEFSGDNDTVYRENWERIFGKQFDPHEPIPGTKPEYLEEEPPTCPVCDVPFFVSVCRGCGYGEDL